MVFSCSLVGYGWYYIVSVLLLFWHFARPLVRLLGSFRKKSPAAPTCICASREGPLYCTGYIPYAVLLDWSLMMIFLLL